jgi:hypothetical protein
VDGAVIKQKNKTQESKYNLVCRLSFYLFSLLVLLAEILYNCWLLVPYKNQHEVIRNNMQMRIILVRRSTKIVNRWCKTHGSLSFKKFTSGSSFSAAAEMFWRISSKSSKILTLFATGQDIKNFL